MANTKITLDGPARYIELESNGEGSARIHSTLDHGRRGSRWSAAMDTFESFVLALFTEGIAFDEKILSAIHTTYEAIGNNID